MRDGVRPNVVCTLPILALWGLDCLEQQAGGRGANGSPQRYHGSKVMTPTAALRRIFASVLVGPRFREQIPCTLASLMASTLEPPAAGPDPHHEASPPARSHPADRAEFKVLPERAAVSGAPQAAPHHPRAARAARAASSTQRPGPLPIEPIRSRPGLGLLHQSPECSKDEPTFIHR